tara:strand:+ start:948 stop:4550 length:3603 start_codon:yes stop_codon:yes gene_type:complete
MAEIKNNFLKSRMNKDLDDRILPNGEYRDAQNIAISKSESSDVGALENILGNSLASSLGLSSNCGITVIGKFMDDVNNRIIIFLTDYTDSSSTRLDNFAPSTSTHQIICYYPTDNTVNILAQGYFLNFSKTHPIYGVNLLENLLFWTDDRNQPRKLNVNAAETNGNWYNTEDTISVCKYYPWKPIRLYKDSGIPISVSLHAGGSGYTAFTAGMATNPVIPGGTGLIVNNGAVGAGGALLDNITISTPGSGYTNGEIVNVSGGGGSSGGQITITTRMDSTMQDVVSPTLPDATVTGTTIAAAGATYTAVIYNTSSGSGAGLTVLLTVNGAGGITNAAVANPGSGYVNGDVVTVVGGNGAGRLQLTVTSTTNPYYNANWPGDPEYLKNKFARFSYRFRFEDGEYSLIAPFTQIAFVPEQDGYFISHDEDRTYTTTEVGFMKNKINDISLMIDSPEGYPWAGLRSTLKIIEMDILYKESDELPIKVIETIPFEEFGGGVSKGTTVFEYQYQSRKPSEVLPESEIIRTSDKVPIRAMAQEVVGNRVVYANFLDKHSSPDTLDYNVSVSLKDDETAFTAAYTHKEYQNNTLKQNRTYQVGVVLCDKYGRQSDVILSSADSSVATNKKGDTIYHYYKDNLFTDGDLINNTTTWPGDSLKVAFNSLIPSTILNDPGYPGLYSADNPLGYYTYKIVVKQTQQGYYNVYFPGILNGGTDALGGNGATVADPTGYMVLTGDNINKIPKKLTDVGPNQNQFSSGRPTYEEDPSYYEFDVVPLASGEVVYGFQVDTDIDPENLTRAEKQLLNRRDRIRNKRTRNSNVILYGRVTNFEVGTTNTESNKRINPGTSNDMITGIGTLQEMGLADMNATPPEVYPKLYNYESNPFAGRLELSDLSVGSTYTDLTLNPLTQLAVYETEPFDSALNIYWETTTSGLISELNNGIGASDLTIPVSLDLPTINTFDEYTNIGGDATSVFYARDNNGAIIAGATMVLSSVQNSQSSGNVVNGAFNLVSVGGGGYKITTASHQYYTAGTLSNKFTAYIQVTNGSNVAFFNIKFSRTNLPPTITNGGGGLLLDLTPGGVFYTLEGNNGARDASVNGKELTWEIYDTYVSADVYVGNATYTNMTENRLINIGPGPIPGLAYSSSVPYIFGSSTVEGKFALSTNPGLPAISNVAKWYYIRLNYRVFDGGGLLYYDYFTIIMPQWQ